MAIRVAVRAEPDGDKACSTPLRRRFIGQWSGLLNCKTPSIS
jgi:hypothetical protein